MSWQAYVFFLALLCIFCLQKTDEPTLGLDVESQHHIRTMLTEENQWWKAVLITTHDIPFAHAVGNKKAKEFS
ncbi:MULTISPECIES: hypothetical protein [Geobacillus]|uniref:hypothetical protein n=1 Tax=Geobacillus TaxID=129337 RepID=UPI0006B3FBA1|nr:MULTISPECIES: hypothetical protein [Geobacillus]